MSRSSSTAATPSNPPTGNGLEGELLARIVRQQTRIGDLTREHAVAERKARYATQSSWRLYEELRRANEDLDSLLEAAKTLKVSVD